MRRREFITAFGSASIFLPTRAHAQPRLPRVGYLTPLPLSFDEDFRRGMRELEYVDGKNITLVERFGGGNDNNLPTLAKELADMPDHCPSWPIAPIDDKSHECRSRFEWISGTLLPALAADVHYPLAGAWAGSNRATGGNSHDVQQDGLACQ